MPWAQKAGKFANHISQNLAKINVETGQGVLLMTLSEGIYHQCGYMSSKCTGVVAKRFIALVRCRCFLAVFSSMEEIELKKVWQDLKKEMLQF
ncbi:hypothetical protein CEXT_513451 [Caerostris extrusa]|uniref:Uncharacterized protein n=1 Tax=Caerostris extrusa TaxID=172846 RepID=A0AAV4WJ31_CAEEX|nr:hypothetical protein CEXT_513451 [Caerostris extrusa]